MKKWLIWLLIVLLVPGMLWAGFAEDEEDSEASLRELIGYSAPDSTIDRFYYGDYDGDGIFEAFALLNEEDLEYAIGGDLWFASPLFCNALQTGKSYCDFEQCGSRAPILFTAEEYYGGSGSTSHLWTVIDSAPVEVNLGGFEGFSVNERGEFVCYPSEFDACTDGTGHTWKAYYFKLDGLTLVEYGGIYIERAQLEQYQGAAEILSAAEAKGYRVGEIIYRDNGVINVNLCNGFNNDNLTLRIGDDGLSVWDAEAEYGGVYDLTSGRVDNVSYPDAFPKPGTYAGNASAGTSAQNAEAAVPQVAGGSGSDSDEAAAFNQFINQAKVATAAPQATAASVAAVATMQPSTQIKQYVRATQDVNIRSEANLNGSILSVMYSGEKLEYRNESQRDERGVDWYKVSVNGATGWVSSACSTLEQGEATSTSAASTSGQSVATSTQGQTVVISGGKCNIRSGPGLGYEVIGSLKEGREVRYLGDSRKDERGVSWYYIDFQGKRGWVSGKYARLR